MAGCAGPYTRVFFEEKDAARCQKLADSLPGHGLTATDSRLPPGDAGLDDLACDIFFSDPETPGEVWVLRVAKFLGPRKLLGWTNVYEVTLQRKPIGADDSDPWQGHLYATRLDNLFKRLWEAYPDIKRGNPVADLVAKEDSHMMRITLCNE
ncbi:hypothetical protein JCM17960_01530 [Magnetospira thiophila]